MNDVVEYVEFVVFSAEFSVENKPCNVKFLALKECYALLPLVR